MPKLTQSQKVRGNSRLRWCESARRQRPALFGPGEVSALSVNHEDRIRGIAEIRRSKSAPGTFGPLRLDRGGRSPRDHRSRGRWRTHGLAERLQRLQHGIAHWRGITHVEYTAHSRRRFVNA